MATATLGTTANNSLTALAFPGSYTRQDGTVFSVTALDADIATINQLIKDDQNINLPAPGAGQWGWSRAGQLYVPNRGWLKLLPGDFVGVDTQTGWPILVSARAAAANPSWVHT
jgi:hypothetical protein